ncbi:MAG: ABC transporter substrate-binding protein [Bacillota bacterium]
MNGGKLGRGAMASLLALALLATVLLPSLAGCARKQALRVAINTDPDGLDPYKTVAAATFSLTRNIFDTLVQTDPTGRLGPDLATDWPVSADGLTYTLKLRPDVYFHNGRKMTADDVKWSLDQMRDPKVHKRAADFAAIQDVKVLAPDQVAIILKKPSAAFLSNLAMGWAAIVPKEAAATMSQNPVGTGPFKFIEWKKDQEITLERFNRYFDPKAAKVDRVVFQVIPEAPARLVALKAGTVDVVPNVPPENAKEVQASSDLKLLVEPMNAVQILAINNKKKPFDDVRVRQALALAVDKQAVIDGSVWGYGQPIASHMPPSSDYYVDLLAQHLTEVAKAKALLAQAGLAKGFKTTIVLPEPYMLHRRAGEVIAEQLKAIGVQADLKVIDWPTWLSEVYTKRNYELTVIGHTGRLDPDPWLNRYVSTSGENYMNFSDPEYDQIIAQAAVSTDAAQRKQLYGRAQEILADQAPAVYLQAPAMVIGLNKAVEGWQVYPIDIYDLRGVSKGK